MNKIPRLIDWVFCLIIVPVMVIVFPLGKYMDRYPLFGWLLVAWYYLNYAANRLGVVPLLFHQRRWAVAGALAMLGGSVLLMAALTHYAPGWPFYKLSQTYATLDLVKVRMSQQRVWLLYLVVQTFSMAVGILDQLNRQRTQRLQAELERDRAEQERDYAKQEWDNAKQALGHVEMTLDRMHQQETAKTITLKSEYKNIVVATDDIVYAEVIDNYVRLYLADGRHPMSQMTLTALLALLPPSSFVRVHKSYLVHRKYVERFNRQQVILRGIARPIPVGRTYADKLWR